MLKTRGLVVSALCLAFASGAQAFDVYRSVTSNATGDLLEARASFTAVGAVLTIVLTNESLSPTASPADFLDSLMFDYSDNFVQPNAANDADQGAAVVVQNNAAYGGTYDLDKEYMYTDTFTFHSLNFDHGISCIGMGIWQTNDDTFYEKMKGLGDAGSQPGDDFGIISAAGTTGNGANSMIGVKNSMTFVLIGHGPIDLDAIDNVHFSFGSGGQTTTAPEPASLAILGIGAIALLRRRSRKQR